MNSMSGVTPSHLRVWENRFGSQKKGLRRYRRIHELQDERGGKASEIERSRAQPRHWAHPAPCLTPRCIQSSDQDTRAGSAGEPSSVSITDLVKEKSRLMHPIRKCLMKSLKQEALTRECDLQILLLSLIHI